MSKTFQVLNDKDMMNFDIDNNNTHTNMHNVVKKTGT